MQYSVWVAQGLLIGLSKKHVFRLGCTWFTNWTVKDACIQSGLHMV